MSELFCRLGPLRQITTDNNRVVCTAAIRDKHHVGIFLMNRTTWGVHSQTYPGWHLCQKRRQQGCETATELKALHAMLQLLELTVPLQVETTNQEAVEQVQRWQRGDLGLPAWYRPVGKQGRWLVRLGRHIAANPDIVSMVHHAGNNQNGSAPDRTLTATLLNKLHYVSRIPNPAIREAELDKVMTLFNNLPE